MVHTHSQNLRHVSLALALLLFCGPAAAHEFWIEPTKFRPASGERVPLKLYVGQHFAGDALLYNPGQFERYVYVGPTGEASKVPGTLGDDSAGSVPIEDAGLYVVGFYSKKFDINFESYEEFEKYLVAEGLERHRALAKKRAKLRDGVFETYTRCAKALIPAGAPNAAPVDRVLGFPLELVAQNNPYRGDGRLTVQLLYRGKPVADALVVAFDKQRPSDRLGARTGQDGRATLTLARPGVWLVNAVHMIPAPLLSAADWESFWASLTFERPD